jgi:uncharacterized repeat protein (TIGR01451 family)
MDVRMNLNQIRRSTRSSSLTLRRTRFRPRLEGLESRLVLSTITWNGKGDGSSFDEGLNWIGGVAPGISDDAVISVKSGVTIDLPATGDSVNSIKQTGGTLVCDSGETDTTAGLTMSGGTLEIENGGTIGGPVTVSASGTLNANDGTLTGTVEVVNSTLNLTAGEGAQTYYIGGASTLEGSIGATQTVQVEGGSGGATTAALTLSPNFCANLGSANLGTILLQSASGSSSASNLAVASGSTFDNDGTVQVNGSVTSHITGNFFNDGTVTVSGGETVDVGTAGDTFTQDSGTLSASGSFICNAGTLLVNGGSVSGAVDAEGCALHLASSIATLTTVNVLGTTTTLISNDAPLGTVWVQGYVAGNGFGGDSGYPSTLTVDAGADNVGTILLQTVSTTTTGGASNLTLASGSTFDNDGTVMVNGSVTSHITGAFKNDNDGTITVSGGSTVDVTGGDFDNDGTVTVSGGATMNTGTAGDTFTQDSGTLSGSGNFICNAGTLLFDGGSVINTVDIEAEGCALQLASSFSTSITVHVLGTTTTLISNDAPLGTVWVQGYVAGNGFGGVSGYPSTLTVDAGADNLGTILLQTVSTTTTGGASNLTVASGSTFDNVGTVTVNSSVASSISGNFTNQGTLNINGVSLTLTSGTSLINAQGGVINASGTLTDSAASFTNNGILSIGTGVAAALKISGAYTQTSTGALDVELGGTTAGTLFDQLNVTGSAVLGGTVNVSLINGFSPANMNSFKIMTYASASGMFLTYNGTNLQNGLILQPSQTSTYVILNAAPAPQADLGVLVGAQPATVTIGANVTYTVTVTNAGPDNASVVTLTDNLPPGATVDSITPVGGTYTVSGTVVTVNFGTLTVGATDTLTIVVTPTKTGTAVDSASVATSYSYDPNPSNNSGSATANVVPLEADLAVSATVQPGQVVIGGNVTYLVTLINNGPNTANGITLSDSLPSGATLDSVVSSTGTTSNSSGHVALTLASLANGASATLTIVVTPTAVGTFTDSASVTDTSPLDPNSNNNTASASATVVPPPSADLGVTIAGPATVTTTGKLSYTVTVTNHGPNSASGSVLTDTFTLPSGASITTETPSQGTVTIAGDTITATLGTIASQATATLTLDVTTTSSGTFVDTASVLSSTADPVPGNNSATLTTPVQGQGSIATTTSSSAATLHQSVTLSATFTPPPGFAVPAGSILFFDGATSLGSATLNASGKASLVVSTLGLGQHSITASYAGNSSDVATTSTAAPLYVTDLVKEDFLGDGKDDLTYFGVIPGTGGLYGFTTLTAASGFNPAKAIVWDNNGHGFGNSASIPVPADYFGDGRAAYAVWQPDGHGYMELYAISSVHPSEGIAVDFGLTTDLPVVGDVDGDGKADFGVYGYYPGVGYRFDFLLSSRTSTAYPFGFDPNQRFIFDNYGHGAVYGSPTATPVVADFDGSGHAGLGVYLPTGTTSTFYYDNFAIPKGTGFVVDPPETFSMVRTFGYSTDVPMAVDYDGDGKADLAVYGLDPKTGHYRYDVLLSSTNFNTTKDVYFDNGGFGYGYSATIPTMADYEGTGLDDFGVYQPDGKGGATFYYQIRANNQGKVYDVAPSSADLPVSGPTYLLARRVRGQ